MGYGGVQFTRATIPCYAKMLVGEFTIKKLEETPRFTLSRESRLEQLVGDLLPAFHPYWKEWHNGDARMGYVLARRVAFYLPPGDTYNRSGKNERQTFLHPRFAPAFSLVTRAIETQIPISNHDIGEAQETSLELQYDGWPGMYVRIDLDYPELIYIGESKNIAKRDHGNSPLFLWDVYGTQDITGAKVLENLIHDRIVEIGAKPFREGKKGLYRFPNNVRAYDMFLKLTRENSSIQSVMRSVTRITSLGV